MNIFADSYIEGKRRDQDALNDDKIVSPFKGMF